MKSEDVSIHSRPNHMKNIRCNNSDTKAGVLTAITSNAAAPPAGDMYRHSDPSITVSLSKRQDLLTYLTTSHPHSRGSFNRQHLINIYRSSSICFLLFFP
ncbi:hypothetical protein AVEN_81379-1 [Araneus ventricosus]|uniref:Uncharacterized protein n=1 Tax=Araneus ventricosus TaxID=182803 RepID=A0A4Y2B6W6_ARAVE|nr:hypothetical protein AVEN_81379-1 [Araneus ventricosus]